MEDEIEQKLKDIAEQTGKSLDQVKDDFAKKKEKLRSRLAEDVSEDRLPRMAAMNLKAEAQRNVRVSGKTEEIPTLVIGHSGERPIGGGETGVIGYGLTNPQEPGTINQPPNDDPPGLSVFVFDESMGCDLGDIREKFQPLNTVKVWASRRQAQTVKNKGRHIDELGSKPPVYLCETTDETRVEEGEFDELPTDRPQIRQLLHNDYITDGDKFTLANHAENLSAMDGGYTADWGADIKRIEGTVVDVVRSDENDWGQYTIVDDSIANVQELESTDLDVGQRGSTLGLKVWMPPEMVKYDVDSVVEVYGTLSRNQDGMIQMQGCGVVPLAAFEADLEEIKPGGGNNGSSGGSGGQSEEPSGEVKKRSI